MEDTTVTGSVARLIDAGVTSEPVYVYPGSVKTYRLTVGYWDNYSGFLCDRITSVNLCEDYEEIHSSDNGSMGGTHLWVYADFDNADATELLISLYESNEEYGSIGDIEETMRRESWEYAYSLELPREMSRAFPGVDISDFNLTDDEMYAAFGTGFLSIDGNEECAERADSWIFRGAYDRETLSAILDEIVKTYLGEIECAGQLAIAGI